MGKFRAILSLVLVAVTVLLVSCGSPTKIPPTYTPEKLSQLQTIVTPIQAARERMPELAKLIQANNWVDTDTFIHGPLGELRQSMSYLSRNLLPDDQKQATELTKNLFGHFEKLDAAAKDQDYALASKQFVEALKDFDAFLDVIPKPKAA